MIDLCINGIIRLFFIIIRFGWNHWGWTITLFIGMFLLLFIARTIGFEKIFGNLVKMGIVEYVLFFPILILLLFMGLLIGTFIASMWTGQEFCMIIEEMSTWLV